MEDNGGELAECLVTRCEQLDSLLQERGEGICPLEAVHDQVGPVELHGVEGASAVDGCTESLGGMEAPGALEVARFPITSVVPVCVVSKCVYTSVVKCVLQRAHSVGARACVRATACVTETPCVDETPCVEKAPCVSGVVASMPGCVLPSTLCVTEAPCVDEAPCMEETPCASGRPCVSGTTCAREMARVSERPSVKEDSVCEVAVCEGDDGGHAGTRNRMSECHDMVCERRDTQVCVGRMETTTATDGQGPGNGRSCIGNRAGFAWRRV